MTLQEIVLLLYGVYFVVKWAVRDGINTSILKKFIDDSTNNANNK